MKKRISADDCNMFQAIAEQLAGVVFVTDLNGAINYVSPSAATILGWQADEILDAPILNYFLEEDRDQARRALRELFMSQTPVKDLHVRMRVKSGGFFYAQFSARLYRNDGEPEGIISFIQDISEQRQAEIILEKQNRTLRALHQVTLDIGTASETLTLLRRIMEKAVELLEADQGGSIFLYDEQQKLLLMVEGAGINERFIGTYARSGDGVAGQVFESGKPLVINDYRNWEGQFLLGETVIPNRVMGVPLLAGEDVIGVLTLFSDSADRIFTEQDVALAEMFAAQASVAYQNTQLYERTQRELNERRQAEIREREQRALAEALRDTAAALNSSLELDDIFEKILDNVEKVVQYDAMTLMWAEGEHLTVIRCRGYSPEEQGIVCQQVFTPEHFPTFAWVMTHHEPLIIPNVELSPLWVKTPLTEHVRSHIKVPIVVEGVVAAVLNLNHNIPNFYNESHAQILQTFANQAALSIRNARLYAQVQHLSIIDDLTGLYNRRGLLEVGRREVSRLQRFKRPLSALFLDIDHFKQFNDRYSYAVGDMILTIVAEYLQNSIREVDIVGRYGGEEMVVLLPEISKIGAVEVAERLRRGIANLRIASEWGDLSITVSIGVAELVPLPGQTIALGNLQRKRLMDLIAIAGDTLHEAKKAGRNRVAVDQSGF